MLHKRTFWLLVLLAFMILVAGSQEAEAGKKPKRHPSLAPSYAGWHCKGPRKYWVGNTVHLAGPVKCRKRTLKYCRRIGRHCPRRNPQYVIKRIFGKHGRAAWRVAWCEGSYRPWASNGQYKGTFQMGISERARFGHGRNLWAQARAARKYFLISGWSPWQCKP